MENIISSCGLLLSCLLIRASQCPPFLFLFIPTMAHGSTCEEKAGILLPKAWPPQACQKTGHFRGWSAPDDFSCKFHHVCFTVNRGIVLFRLCRHILSTRHRKRKMFPPDPQQLVLVASACSDSHCSTRLM